MEVINFPVPSAAAFASSPLVHRAMQRGMRWKESPAPSSTAISPAFFTSGLFPFNNIVKPAIIANPR